VAKFCQVIRNAAANHSCPNNDSLGARRQCSGFGVIIKLSCSEVFFKQVIHDRGFLLVVGLGSTLLEIANGNL
jgi:hypothetical protein